MNFHRFIAVSVVAVISTVSNAHAMEPKTHAQTAVLLKDYLQLRADVVQKKPGIFYPELDGYGRRMFKVMHELGEALGKPRYTQAEIVDLLGKPDATIEEGKAHSGIAVPAGETHLIYFWRGWHDYLYFISRDGKIQKADWYYAYE